ncbi:MAG: hypothetical protein AYK18_07410 [Theionarchaea archaeon DG-70]|nr:MAG: hypothetical protein AYK18_07410 [Theionarchaea archaeon DG-70]
MMEDEEKKTQGEKGEICSTKSRSCFFIRVLKFPIQKSCQLLGIGHHSHAQHNYNHSYKDFPHQSAPPSLFFKFCSKGLWQLTIVIVYREETTIRLELELQYCDDVNLLGIRDID